MRVRELIKTNTDDHKVFNVCDRMTGNYLIKGLTKRKLLDNAISSELLDKPVKLWGINNGYNDISLKGSINVYVIV